MTYLVERGEVKLGIVESDHDFLSLSIGATCHPWNRLFHAIFSIYHICRITVTVFFGEFSGLLDASQLFKVKLPGCGRSQDIESCATNATVTNISKRRFLGCVNSYFIWAQNLSPCWDVILFGELFKPFLGTRKLNGCIPSNVNHPGRREVSSFKLRLNCAFEN